MPDDVVGGKPGADNCHRVESLVQCGSGGEAHKPLRQSCCPLTSKKGSFNWWRTLCSGTSLTIPKYGTGSDDLIDDDDQ